MIAAICIVAFVLGVLTSRRLRPLPSVVIKGREYRRIGAYRWHAVDTGEWADAVMLHGDSKCDQVYWSEQARRRFGLPPGDWR